MQLVAEKLTNAIYEGTKTISKYFTADIPMIDIFKVGSYSYLVQHANDDKFGQFTVEVCTRPGSAAYL